MEMPDVPPAVSRLQDLLLSWNEAAESGGDIEQSANAVRAGYYQCLQRGIVPALTGSDAQRMTALRTRHPEVAESLDDVEPEDFRREPVGAGSSHSSNGSWSD